MPRSASRLPVPEPTQAGAGELRRVGLDRIDVPPRRMRRDLGDVASLASSLDTYGQLAPVVCLEAPDGRLQLIAGERRLAATRHLHASRVQAGQVAPDAPAEIDVLVRQLHAGQTAAELELIENEQRRELSDEEEADAFTLLVRESRRTLVQVAEMSGRSVAYVSKRMRVFDDPRLREAIALGQLSTSQAEELLALPEAIRRELLDRAVGQRWTHEQLRRTVRGVLALEALRDLDGDAHDAPKHFRFENSARPLVTLERPADLTRQLRALDALLGQLRPFQLTTRDWRALGALRRTLGWLLDQAPR